MKLAARHFWQGKWIDDAEFETRLASLSQSLGEALVRPLNVERLLATCGSFAKRLREDEGLRKRLTHELKAHGEILSEREAEDAFSELAEFLEPRELKRKLRCELGSERPAELRRTQYERSVFESWAPLGILVHVTPGNVFTVAVLSALEGLLAGNLNFVKVSGGASLFSHFFFEEFLKCDSSGELEKFLIVSRFASNQREWLKTLLLAADGLAAWGGESAISSLRSLLPSTARFIAWGHRLSFAYVSHAKLNDPSISHQIAREICALDQQACSSPQCVYIDTDDVSVLRKCAESLASALAKISPEVPAREPDRQEAAEITIVTEKHRVVKALNLGDLIVDEAGGWRVLVDHRAELVPSPLFRSIWVRPLPAKRIIETLRPLRGYLQTVGLAADVSEMPELTRLLQIAGVLRFRPLGRMLESYAGEPHDGEYALSRYARRLTFEGDARLIGLSSFSQIEKTEIETHAKVKISGKAEFQAQSVADQDTELVFKSGGSSGKAKISIFTYDDYHRQMSCAADGLYAAGLDPVHDRCMNLFFGGGLYGGFISFFTILEFLRAKHLPMSAHEDLNFVVDMIIEHRVNVLLGMPSYLLRLFERGGERLAKAGVVKKIFFGGEHFTQAQRRDLMARFGVDVIRSATYGSVDAGPLGYQCRFCDGSIHHLHRDLQKIEIVKLESDEPVAADEAGRLIFSSKVRTGQALERYEIGDVGRWIEGDCPCGRQGPRFELLGRHGDVMRIGGSYLNYRKWEKVLSETLAYAGELQVVISQVAQRAELELRLQRGPGLTKEKIRSVLFSEDHDLEEIVAKDQALDLLISLKSGDEFERTPGSGKLIRILDRRVL